MESDKKWMYLSFVAATFLVAWVMNKVVVLAMSYARLPNPLYWGTFTAAGVGSFVGVSLFAYFYLRRPVAQTYSLEVLQEVKKVNWPARKMAMGATGAVIVAVTLMAFVLGAFDWACAGIIKFMLSGFKL